jgi:putative DNA primase/helicase
MDACVPSDVSKSYILTDIKKLDRWICWQYQDEGDYRAKRPVNLNPGTGNWYPVSYRDPDSWYSYEEARELCDRHSSVDGLQVVVKHRDDDFVIVDLDDCIEEGEVEDWAMQLVNSAGTYAEISPSGTGLHLLFRGSVDRQGWAGPEDEFDGEVYKKYIITVTGDHVVGTPYQAKQNNDFLEMLFEQNDIWWRDQLYESDEEDEVYGAPTIE